MIEIAYVAGEASGDRHAAALHGALAATAPEGQELRGWGIGGNVMRGLGIEITQNSSRWGSIGFVAAFRDLPMYSAALRRFKAELLRRKPDALILIDFGYFNVRLARWARANHIGPIIYYQPPGSWKRNPHPEASQELGRLTDLIITPFSWSDKCLRAAGANSHWVGHPLVDIVKPVMSPADFDHEFGVDPQRPVIALLPGSRSAEVAHILPMMLRAASIISKRVPGSQFLLAAAPNLNRKLLERMLLREQASRSPGSKFHVIERAGGRLKKIAASAMDAANPAQKMVTSEGFLISPEKHADQDAMRKSAKRFQQESTTPTLAIVENLTYDCLERADIVISCSGTATLEAVILNRPTIIVYKVSKLTEFEYHLRKRWIKIDYIGLPNIIANEMVAPELVLDAASPEAVADMAVGMLVEPEQLLKAKRAMMEKIHPELGEPGVINRAAALVWATIQPKR